MFLGGAADSAGILHSVLHVPSCMCTHAPYTVHPDSLQYVVETKYVGERPVEGAATEIVGNERNVVKEEVKPAQAGASMLYLGVERSKF